MKQLFGHTGAGATSPSPFSRMPMKRARGLLLAGVMSLSAAGCQDFLDVNTNPNAPEEVAANLYLAPMLHWMVTGPQFDGRFVGRYTQQWMLANGVTSLPSWERMGYDPLSDNGGQQWRDVYWSFGQNLIDMNRKAEAEKRWDLLGVGLLLKAWGWQNLTDLHGEIIIKEANDPTKFSFSYDTQEFAYQEVQRLVDSAIVLLRRSDDAVDQGFMARGDRIYGGNRAQWLKFAWGLKAISLNHFSNKSTYNPAAVIAAVDSSFRSNADDALLTYTAGSPDNADYNFWGRSRGNIHNYRQTQFVLGLMNGTVTGTPDPRMTRMLAPSPDGLYRGLDPDVVGFGALTAAQQPMNFHGYAGTGGVGQPGRYLFDDKAKIPAMTYAELQFVKAEAAFRGGNAALALDAFTKGVSAHIDFVNARNTDNGQTPTQITAAEKAAFLAAVVPATPAELTLTDIMTQKYIALWGWGHNELWMDMRRYHYTDLDPATGVQVYPGFELPSNLYPDNNAKPVYRIRPRYNSEYVWNRAGLDAIGGLAADYHTVPIWIVQP